MLRTFSCICWTSAYFLWKKCLSGFCDNFYSFFCLFVLLLSWMGLMFWVLTPFQIYNLKIFSHFRLLFHFIDGMLSCAVAFHFEIVPLFFFFLPLLLTSDSKNHHQGLYQRTYHLFSSRSLMVWFHTLHSSLSSILG